MDSKHPPNSSDRILTRFKKIVGILKTQKIDGLLLNFEPNVTYAVGFHAPDAYGLITTSGITLVTDFRYVADFQAKTWGLVEIKQYHGSIFKTVAQEIRKRSLKHVGFESRHLSFAECEIFHQLLKNASQFIPLRETIEPLREVKDTQEIKSIKKAIAITQKTFSYIRKFIKPGAEELEVAAEIERYIRLCGASSAAFDIIVASGPNSSYPHARISNRRFQKGDPVVIDMGVEFNDYKCDLTRTFFLGKISTSAQKVYSIVRQAQRRAIKIIQPGIAIKDIDQEARNYIEQKGFGKFFGHALGHGIGLEVHESPSINKKNNQRLKAGSVFTVEPGIYRTGEFGVRIEDIVLVTNNGAEILSGNNND